MTLYEKKFTVEYPTKKNRLQRAFANNTFGKSFTKALHFHALSTVMQRFSTHQEELKKVSIDDFYKDKDIVGEDFLLSNVWMNLSWLDRVRYIVCYAAFKVLLLSF